MPLLVGGQGLPKPPLASLDDLADLGVAVSESKGLALLAQASARFRSEARNDFTLTANERVLRATQGYVRLNRLPVVGILGVWQVARDGSRGAPVVGWTFDGIDKVNVAAASGIVFNAYHGEGTRQGRGPYTYHVAWTSGFEEVPDDVQAAVLSMVKRAITAPLPEGVITERVGDYSISTGSHTASGAISMTRDEMAVAKKYRPRHLSMGVEAV